MGISNRVKNLIENFKAEEYDLLHIKGYPHSNS